MCSVELKTHKIHFSRGSIPDPAGDLRTLPIVRWRGDTLSGISITDLWSPYLDKKNEVSVELNHCCVLCIINQYKFMNIYIRVAPNAVSNILLKS